jgi:hypothetical protein
MVDPTFPFDPIPQTSLSFVGGILIMKLQEKSTLTIKAAFVI